ncbi:MAG: hypothetical protein ACO3ND_08890 [Opitutales bacterium]
MRRHALLLLALAAALTAEPARKDHAKYAAALKEFRAGRAAPAAALRDKDSPPEVRRAAVDALRELLLDEPAGPLAKDAAGLLSVTDVGTARLLLAALAEAKVTSAADAVAALAGKAGSPLRVDAALALAEIGGARAVPLLAVLAGDETLNEAATEALGKTAGPGVTDAFIAGIRNKELAAVSRAALIRASVARNNRAVAAALCDTVAEEEMRMESQKGLLRLATAADLPALRKAERSVGNEATKAALGRLIKKLEAAK